METTFNPSAIEKNRYQEWERSGYFKPSGSGDAFAIMIPPPNVTGSLHMGHGFQEAIMDALVRYQRMKGKNTLWQVGTDHAGIATQLVVERQLEAEGFIHREVYPVVPPKVEYSITDKGRTAIPIIETIRNYGLELMEREGINHK